MELTRKGRKKLVGQAFPSMTEREPHGMKELIQHRQEIESLQVSLLASKESIRRSRQEKKELLRTNFVSTGDLET